MDHLILEVGLALGLIAAAVSLAAKLKFSNVPFLILIGMAVGPHAQQLGVFDFRFVASDARREVFNSEFNVAIEIVTAKRHHLDRQGFTAPQ